MVLNSYFDGSWSFGIKFKTDVHVSTRTSTGWSCCILTIFPILPVPSYCNKSTRYRVWEIRDIPVLCLGEKTDLSMPFSLAVLTMMGTRVDGIVLGITLCVFKVSIIKKWLIRLQLQHRRHYHRVTLIWYRDIKREAKKKGSRQDKRQSRLAISGLGHNQKQLFRFLFLFKAVIMVQPTVSLLSWPAQYFLWYCLKMPYARWLS